MRQSSISLLVCVLLCISFCYSMEMEDNISKFKKRSTVDDWILQYMVEDEHLVTCKAQTSSCCFDKQTITAKKVTVGSKTAIVFEGPATGTSCPTDSADASKKKLVIKVMGYTNDSDLIAATGKLIIQTNIGQATDTTFADTVSNASLSITDKSDQNHYAINIPSINSNSYNEQQALNHVMIMTGGEDGHMSSSLLKMTAALFIGLFLIL